MHCPCYCYEAFQSATQQLLFLCGINWALRGVTDHTSYSTAMATILMSTTAYGMAMQGAKSSPAKKAAPAKKETGKGKTAAGKTAAAAKGGKRKAQA